jgi:hypothetical protein
VAESKGRCSRSAHVSIDIVCFVLATPKGVLELSHGTHVMPFRQALELALQLLADLEAQIRSALGLAASASIYDAASEQLQSLPPFMLETLEVRVNVTMKGFTRGACIQLTCLSGVR